MEFSITMWKYGWRGTKFLKPPLAKHFIILLSFKTIDVLITQLSSAQIASIECKWILYTKVQNSFETPKNVAYLVGLKKSKNSQPTERHY